MGNRVIDLRPSRGGRQPSPGQQPLFAGRPRSSPPRDPGKRPLPLRTRRRRVRAILALAALLLIGAAVFAASRVSYLPQFNIQSVSVVGTQYVPPDLVRSYVNAVLDDGSHRLLSRRNIFLYPRAVIERGIVSSFPRIRSASISSDSLFSTALTVTVAERQPFALWCAQANASSSACYQMDDTGFVFAVAQPGASSTQYIFSGALSTSTNPIGQSFTPAHLPGILALLTDLGQAGYTARGATVESDEDFSVSVSDGFLIKASFGEDPGGLVKNLQLVLSSDALQGKTAQLQYIDLRFGDRVYYKLIGQSQASSTPR